MGSIKISNSQVSGIVNAGNIYQKCQDRRPGAAPPANMASDVRLILGVDTLGYGISDPSQQHAIQERLSHMLSSLIGIIGLDRDKFIAQESGDGFMLFFPPVSRISNTAIETIETIKFLAKRRALDNLEPRVVKYRAAFGCGPISEAAMGSTGRSVIHVADLLDSHELRTSANRQQAENITIGILEPLSSWVIEGGFDCDMSEPIFLKTKRDDVLTFRTITHDV